MADELILAIDQGTSGTKTIVIDSSGTILARAAVPLRSDFPMHGFVEQDPEAIYSGVIESVSRCIVALRNAGRNPSSIAACGISNQRETFLLWDEHGSPLCPAVGWQCKRSVSICDRLRAEGLAQDVKKRTGLVIDPYFSATKLIWLTENDDTTRRAVSEGRAHFGTIDAWLLWRLTGGTVFATDFTNASRTLLFNLDELSWDAHLLQVWGLSSLRLPSVHPSSFPFGETNFQGTLHRLIPISSMIGDSHAAAFGEGCFTSGSAKATMGTGSSILMNVGSRRMDSQGGMVSTICWSSKDRVDYALEGIIVTAGATIKWLRDQVGLFGETRETEAMALSVPDNGGVYFVPAFSGLGAPWWQMDLRAAILGLTFDSTRNHIVRAALESIPYQIADVIDSMEADSGVKLEELKVDGGITSNHFVMQFVADLLSATVVNIGLEEVSALGAAYLAGLETGVFRNLQALASLSKGQIYFSPGPGRADAQRCHEEWKKILTRLI